MIGIKQMTNLQQTHCEILRNHGIEYIIQDDLIMALSVEVKDNKTFSTWVNIDRLNIWNWLGY